MSRRELIMLLAGAAAWPLDARAQPRTVPTIGFLGPTAPQAWTTWTKAFVDRFAELGWVDGRTVKIVYRLANGQIERASELAAELVALKVDLIVTSGSVTRPAMKATSLIPIIFALASEPVAAGYVGRDRLAACYPVWVFRGLCHEHAIRRDLSAERIASYSRGGFARATDRMSDEVWQTRLEKLVKDWGSGEMMKAIAPSQIASPATVAQFAKFTV